MAPCSTSKQIKSVVVRRSRKSGSRWKTLIFMLVEPSQTHCGGTFTMKISVKMTEASYRPSWERGCKIDTNTSPTSCLKTYTLLRITVASLYRTLLRHWCSRCFNNQYFPARYVGLRLYYETYMYSFYIAPCMQPIKPGQIPSFDKCTGFFYTCTCSTQHKIDWTSEGLNKDCII